MSAKIPKPTIKELGKDLLIISKTKVLQTILQPLLFFALYFVFAYNGAWIFAILSVMGMSFTTYGSTSHDLVHRNLGINKRLNDFLLSFIELISIRSGHAYKYSHLNHHKKFPSPDDIEGKAAGMSFIRSLLEGPVFQLKLFKWSLKNVNKTVKNIILLEGSISIIFIIISIWSLQFTPVFFVYTTLIIMGSWIIPLATSYVVHKPHEKDELHQTKLFRGRFYSIIAFKHLYHLEHHMYPMVPHKNWPKLAKRLDPFFEKMKIRPIKLSLIKH